MLDTPAPLQSSDEYALPDKPAPASGSGADAPQRQEDRPASPADARRRSLLARAARVYAETLLVLAPGPDVSAKLMREQFAEQVENPERYHRIDEVENDKGLRIGDTVVRSQKPDRLFTVTSVCAHETDGERRVEVHTIAPDTYGGWTSLESVQKTPDIRLASTSSSPDDTYETANKKRTTKTGDTRRVIKEQPVTEADFQERQNHQAIAAAVKWGFDPAMLTPDQNGWITPRFEHIEFAVQITASGAHAEITLAQAPNGNWAGAAAYSEKQTSQMSRPFPNQGYRQHPSRDAAIREQLAFLHDRLSKNLFAQVELAAGIASAPDESSPAPAAGPDRVENAQPAANGSTTPMIEQARELLARYIDESGDLFGTGGIHLLAGPFHAPKRVKLLSLLRGGAKVMPREAGTDALRDAFYAAAGILGSDPIEKEANFGRWCKRASNIHHGPPPGNPPAASTAAPTIDADVAAQGAPEASAGQGSPGGAANDATGPTTQYAVASTRVAEWVAQRLCLDLPAALTARELFDVADKAFGGTLAAGHYTAKDAYDAMEAGIHRALLDMRLTPDGSAIVAARKLATLDGMLARVPSQTRRTVETEEYQQFSTPPSLAFAASWAANIASTDIMVEPSAGTGSIAVFGILAGAEVVVNELSPRRAAILAALFPQQRLFTENAEQLNNVLPDSIRPTVIVMNPPFSATAGRMSDTRQSQTGARHVEQALKRLVPGGRLVAIVGSGMAMDRPGSAQWWDSTEASYTVRANIGIDGKNYAKYGTGVDVQLIVIDKTGATRRPVLAAKVETVAELLPLLEEIRHDRPVPGRENSPFPSPESSGIPVAAERLEKRPGNGDPYPDALGSGQRPIDSADGAQPSGPGSGRSDDLAARPRQAEAGAGVPDRPGTDGERRDSPVRGGSGVHGQPAGRGVPATGKPLQQHGGDRPVGDQAISIAHRPSAKNTEALSDAIYEHYQPQRLSIAGAHPHPGKLVQSAAMAATEPPIPHYVPSLPRSVVELGLLSLPQLETVVYAGQAHEQRLPDGRRRGFFIGDGTGVGKGRTIAGIILDNLCAGRGKAVWISEKGGLLRDAQRDYAGVGGNPATMFAQSRVKIGDALPAREGILFASYTLLAATQKNTNAAAVPAAARARLLQLLAWLGNDFDGIIAFDESHNMANSVSRRGARGITTVSAKALAGIALQEALPNARVVYVSATGATEVSNLAYAGRLGLWGEGTPFAKVSDFIGAISAGGVAAMELVSRDMKAMGSYLARSLSFDGVTYERLEHTLTPLQTDIYNELAGAWQTVLQNVDRALSDTGQAKDGAAKSAALSRFWGAHQRFFNQIITSMQMPTVIARARADIARGDAVVMQLVNTNEAAQERQLAGMAAAGADLDELDFTPRQNLIDYVKTGFPIQQYEEYKDGNGNVRSRPVLDAAGNPVTNKEMEARRDALVVTLNEIRVPDNPIDSILNAFGADAVAEVTGRSRRFILERNDKGDLEPVEQKRSPAAAAADADAFMDDKKRILVFSDAGGTGYSFHADLTRANQRKRIHYLIQPGWRADKAIQGMGRTHRTNEASPPHYVLPTTNLEAQRRFISSIARRLDQLGALTKGQRQTGSQGLFDASDNLESDYARRALHTLFTDMYAGHARLDFGQTTHAMGLNGLIDSRTGALNESKLPTIPQFLNRLLSLKTDEQDRVFGEFFGRMEHLIEMAKEQGNYDHGVETIRAQSIQKLRDEIVHVDKRTGAETHYVELALHHPTNLTQFDALPIRLGSGEVSNNFLGYFRNEKNNKVFALQRTGQGTSEKGEMVTRARNFSPAGPMRHVENADHVAAATLGRHMIKRHEVVRVYGGQPFTETWTRNGVDHTERSGTAAAELETKGMAALERLASMPGIANERRAALVRVVERIKAELTDKEVEREVRAYTRLPEAAARAAWNAELDAAPKTHLQHVHLITGALLPIWDRIPGSPRVIRTQTDEGERILGRTVAPSMLQQTLKNLGVGSDAAKLTPEQVLGRVLDGTKVILANGWEVTTARVSQEVRIEIVSATMGDGDRRILEQQGAFCERIQWRERMFIPTGDLASAVLARILESKPVAELYEKSRENDESNPVFSQGRPRKESTASSTSNGRTGIPMATLRDAATAIQARWPGVPPLRCVQSPADLPFPALPTTRGAFHGGTIYLVAANIVDLDDLQFVIGHEALGHAGLRMVLDGENLSAEMSRLRRINPCLDRAAWEKTAAYGYSLDLGTEEALCDLAGQGREIHGLQRLMLAIQNGLRQVGLGKLADWFEGKTQSETLDLLRQAKAAITEQVHEPEPTAAPMNAVFAHQERRENAIAQRSAPLESTACASAKNSPQLHELVRTSPARNAPPTKSRLDPYGLRAFGLATLNQVHPAYRDTENWRTVPAIMVDRELVGSIRTALAQIEEAHGGMLSLDANGNIVISQWNSPDDMQFAMTSIAALADHHGLGVLIKKAAFPLTVENASALRRHGFDVVGASVTLAATGRNGPPNNVTFIRNPNGAPLFSHAAFGARPGDWTSASLKGQEVTAAVYTAAFKVRCDATNASALAVGPRKTRRTHVA